MAFWVKNDMNIIEDKIMDSRVKYGKQNNEQKFRDDCVSDEQTHQNTQAQQPQQNDFVSKLACLGNTEDSAGDFDKSDIEQNKVMAVFAYLSWLVLIPIFAAPKSKFARFHANQGLVLAIAEVLYGIVYSILSSVMLTISLSLYFLVSILELVSLVFLVMAIIGIVNSVNGNAKELPIIGRFKLLK